MADFRDRATFVRQSNLSTALLSGFLVGDMPPNQSHARWVDRSFGRSVAGRQTQQAE
jgi:hypothetical protein